MNHKTGKKMNVGGYVAIAKEAKGIAPKYVDAIDEKIASRIKPKVRPVYYDKGGKVYKRYIVYVEDSYDGDILGSSDTFRGASMIMKKLENKGAFKDVSPWGLLIQKIIFSEEKTKILIKC